jgi:hypothetical protein
MNSEMKINFEIIDDLCKTMTVINQKVEDNRLKTPGTMNIAEIMNRHHLENQHSNVLSFLIDPKEKHNHKEYGELFLALLKERGLKLQGNRILSVTREDSTDEARRMDLFIETDSDSIILENKVCAGDQDFQIEDYLTYVENLTETSENVFVVYLTISGKDPSEKSISTEKLQELKDQKRFINLSYSKDILNWLLELKTKNEEDILRAGIIQYIDVVKAISNQRKEVFNMDQAIAKELVNEYRELTREKLKEKMIALYSFQNNINIVLFINFFKDVFQEANGKLILFCKNKDTYDSIEEWENDVITNQEYFGVRYTENNSTIDLFMSDLISNRFVFACKGDKKISSIGSQITFNGYPFASEPANSWFLNAILAMPDNKKNDNLDWERRNKSKLSSHVVKNWFNI